MDVAAKLSFTAKKEAFSSGISNILNDTSIGASNEKIAAVASLFIIAVNLSTNLYNKLVGNVLATANDKQAFCQTLDTSKQIDTNVRQAARLVLSTDANGELDIIINKIIAQCGDTSAFLQGCGINVNITDVAAAKPAINQDNALKAGSLVVSKFCQDFGVLPKDEGDTYYGQAGCTEMTCLDSDDSYTLCNLAYSLIKANTLAEAGIYGDSPYVDGHQTHFRVMQENPLAIQIKNHADIMVKPEKGKPWLRFLPMPTYPGYDEVCVFLALLGPLLFLRLYLKGINKSSSVLTVLAGFFLYDLHDLHVKLASLVKSEFKELDALCGVSKYYREMHAINPRAYPLAPGSLSAASGVSTLSVGALVSGSDAEKASRFQPFVGGASEPFCYNCGTPLSQHASVPQKSGKDGKGSLPDYRQCPASNFLKKYVIVNYRADAPPMIVEKTGK